MSVKAQVISAVRWTAGGRLASQVVTWAITLVVIRLLTPEDYGLMGMALVIIGLCTLMSDLGIAAALIQTKDLDDYVVRQSYGLVLLVNFALCVAVFASAPLVAAFYGEERLVLILRVLSLTFIVQSLASVPRALLTRSIEFKHISIVEFVAVITNSLVTLALAFSGYGVWALVVGNIAVCVVNTVGILLVCGLKITPVFRFGGMGKLISYSIKISGQRIVWFFGQNLDVILIGKLLGKTTLGYYSVGFHLASMPMHRVMAIINQVAFPTFSRIQDDPALVRNYFLEMSKLISLIFFPLMWGLSSVSEEVVAIFLGEKWSNASFVLIVLCLAIPFRVNATVLPPLMNAIGQPGKTLVNSITEASIIAIGVLIGVAWGLSGVVIGVSCAYLIAWQVVLWRCLPYLGTTWSQVAAALSPTVFSAATMYAAVYLSKMLLFQDLAPPVMLGLMIFVGAAVYGGLTLVFNRDTVNQAIMVITSKQ